MQLFLPQLTNFQRVCMKVKYRGADGLVPGFRDFWQFTHPKATYKPLPSLLLARGSHVGSPLMGSTR